MMKRRKTKNLWLMLAAVIAVILVITGCSTANISQSSDNPIETKNMKGEKPRSFTDDELTAANLALVNGIKIDDPQNDYFEFPLNHFQPDGRPDNDNPYPLPYTDLRSVSVGADDNYIYFKFQYWGNFPTSSVVYNGDLLWSIGSKAENFTYINADGIKDSAELSNGINLVDYIDGQRVETDNPSIGQLAMISPIGKDAQMEEIYKTMNGAGLVAGGAGQDFILSAFPLSLFGIHLADEVAFSCSTETGSTKYHHVCVDFLLGRDGYLGGSVISYKLGDKEYNIVAIPTDVMR